jgi:glycerol kinase
VVGLTRGATRAHLARAALEAMAYQAVDAIEAMRRAGAEPLEELRADGAATVNRWLMQFQADVLGVPVVVPEVAETTAMGAALLAGVGANLLTLDQVRSLGDERARYEPRMGEDERAALLDGWHRALERSRNWAAE